MQAKDYLGKKVIPKGLNYVCVITGVPKTQRGLIQDSVVMVEFPCYLPGYTHQCTFTVNETHYLIDRKKFAVQAPCFSYGVSGAVVGFH